MKRVYKEVGSLDTRCYEQFYLNEDILMEHAANSLANEIKNRVPKGSRVFLLCGGGNNGADGIACARILHKDYETFVMLPYGTKSKMAKLQLDRYRAIDGKLVDIVIDADIYVDALFGSGLKRELDDTTCELIKILNSKNGYKLSCDIPSGIGDGFLSKEVFRADKTITMGALKLSLFEDNTKDFVGEIEVSDLGISSKVYENESSVYLLDRSDLNLPIRIKQDSNKGTYGHTVVICGEKEGAGLLSANAAFNFGSGLVSIVSKNSCQTPPHIMNMREIPKNSTSLVVGMGLGNYENINNIINLDIPIVIDADLFYQPIIKDILKRKKDVVLTPHPKEFASLLEICSIAKVDVKEIQRDRFGYIKTFANHFPDVTILLKGSNVLIYGNDKIFINPFGSVMLAKGGSGDVLSGMIGALLSQEYTSLEATINASLAHSLSIERLRFNNYALNPMDICEGIRWL